jgi:hypothetical protein
VAVLAVLVILNVLAFGTAGIRILSRRNNSG